MQIKFTCTMCGPCEKTIDLTSHIFECVVESILETGEGIQSLSTHEIEHPTCITIVHTCEECASE